MDARVTDCVFGQPFHIIDSFGWVSVTDKFGIQVLRVIRRLQREPEVVHRKHVFEKLGFLKISNPAGLSRRIELMG